MMGKTLELDWLYSLGLPLSCSISLMFYSKFYHTLMDFFVSVLEIEENIKK